MVIRPTKIRFLPESVLSVECLFSFLVKDRRLDRGLNHKVSHKDGRLKQHLVGVTRQTCSWLLTRATHSPKNKDVFHFNSPVQFHISQTYGSMQLLSIIDYLSLALAVGLCYDTLICCKCNNCVM